jgi:hypothetical protein
MLETALLALIISSIFDWSSAALYYHLVSREVSWKFFIDRISSRVFKVIISCATRRPNMEFTPSSDFTPRLIDFENQRAPFLVGQRGPALVDGRSPILSPPQR